MPSPPVREGLRLDARRGLQWAAPACRLPQLRAQARWLRGVPGLGPRRPRLAARWGALRPGSGKTGEVVTPPLAKPQRPPAEITREYAEGRRYRVAALSGGRDRHTASGRPAKRNTDHEGQTESETQLENTWATPVGPPAPRAPAISSSNETSDAPGVANGRPAPPGSRSAAARTVGITGAAGAPPPRSPSPTPRMTSPARRRGPLARSPRVPRFTSAHPGSTAPAEWRDHSDSSAALKGVLPCSSIPQAKAPSRARRTRDLQPQYPSLDMWLPAWRVDLDMLVERFASQCPIAFFGAAKIWSGWRYRIARVCGTQAGDGRSPIPPARDG